MRHDESWDVGAEAGGFERVEPDPNLRVELSVPLTPEQMAGLSRLARQQGVHEIGAIQMLVDRAIAAEGD